MALTKKAIPTAPPRSHWTGIERLGTAPATCPTASTATRATTRIQPSWTRTSMPRILAIGTPVTGVPRSSAGFRHWLAPAREAIPGWAAPPSRRVAIAATPSATTSRLSPTTIEVSDQKASGKSWVRR